MSLMSYNSAAGVAGMLKEGTRYYSNEDDGYQQSSVVLSNIDACMQIARMLRTSLGPQGRSKLVVNHLQKIIVTSDCSSILKEVEVQHPAAKLLVQACHKQKEECGDNTNFVLAFGGELLWQTAVLIGKMTWQPAPEILAGYKRALELCETTLLPQQVCGRLTDPTDRQQLLTIVKPVIASKLYGYENVLGPLVADACLRVMNSDTKKVSVESVRTVKLLGSSVEDSSLVDGYVAKSGVETVLQAVKNAKVAVYACGFEASNTETKGTVLMKTADDLKNYNKTEETKMQEIVAGIAAAGVKVVVTGGNLSDMALHFLDRYQLLGLRMGSKWELRRLCAAVSATALVRLGTPTPDEMGHAAAVTVHELGGRAITVFSVDPTNSTTNKKLATIVLRASTWSTLNDLERAVDDGVQALAQATKHGADDGDYNSNSSGTGQYVYGGGAAEMALSVALQREADRVPGLEQYALEAFARALQIVPRTLAENAGWDATRVLADLQTAHSTTAATNEEQGAAPAVCDVGVNIEGVFSEPPPPSTTTTKSSSTAASTTCSMGQLGVVDLLSTKRSALRLAVDAVITILKIDQIIMSKPSGGPKPK